MKHSFLAVALAALASLTGVAPRANAAVGQSITFKMVPSAGAAACLPSTAHARVTISDLGTVQNLHLEVFSLPPNTEFTTFVVQSPNKPFGLGWYQGDVVTDRHGRGVADFRGIFNDETFIVSDTPIQMDHLGTWFADPNDAQKVGCPNTPTPFDGDHTAGIQVLNTSNFPTDKGPLLNLK